MPRRSKSSATADELTWMIYEELRGDVGNYSGFAVAVVPHATIGWRAVPSKRGLRPDIAAAIVTIERRLRMPASAEVALTVMEYED